MTENAYQLPASLRERILAMLADEPGWHTGASVHASFLDDGQDAPSLQAIYNELGRMVRKGELKKTRETAYSTAPLTYYCLAPTQTSP